MVIATVLLASCVSQPIAIKEMVLPEEKLIRIDYEEGSIALCRINYEAHKDLCYTSKHAGSVPPLGVLYGRFNKSLKQVSGLTEDEANGVALCTLGFLMSCELNNLLDEIDYKRDGEFLYQLLEILKREKNPFLEKKVPLESIYPRKYKLTNEQQFEEVLRKAILELKNNNNQWRKDWR